MENLRLEYIDKTGIKYNDFYRMPKVLVKGECFKNVSIHAKIIYTLMLSRVSLSVKNGWFDKAGRAYIYFTIDEVMDYLKCGNTKASNIMKELDEEHGLGLIEKKYNGYKKPNRIYVKEIVTCQGVDNLKLEYIYKKGVIYKEFYPIPKVLFESEYLKNVSVAAKFIYMLLLNQASLSVKNGWFNEAGRGYILFSTEKVKKHLKCGKNKACNIMKELDDENGIGLIEKKRQGLGKCSIIFVKKIIKIKDTEAFSITKKDELKKQSCVKQEQSERICKMRSMNSQNQTLEGSESKHIEVYKTSSNKNYINYNSFSYNKSNHIVSVDERCDIDEIKIIQKKKKLIKKNIDYDFLIETYPEEKDFIKSIYEIIVEIVLCKENKIWIAREKRSVELVKRRFLSLTYEHVVYAIDSIKATTSHILKFKSYLLATLFNAPVTIDAYYENRVRHDMLINC